MLYFVLVQILFLMSITFADPFGYDDTHIFGVNRIQLQLNEQARQFQQLELINHQRRQQYRSNRQRLQYLENDRRKMERIIFKGEVSCERMIGLDFGAEPPQEFRILKVQAFENGKEIGNVFQFGRDIVIFEDNQKNLIRRRNLTIRIEHTGCFKNSDNCYSVTMIPKNYDPRERRRLQMENIDLLQRDYLQECYGFFHRFIRAFKF